ncbi:hypothetical protein E2C01_031142 [Portunus trituberculatus]|uniref:Uncharacterized protein n=1 Tax=Portunus trituberculatus TaxID=210409 RepID=A0A5B7EW35_PORTR|nr:hypothetical protein [Portunus trituberculatus]
MVSQSGQHTHIERHIAGHWRSSLLLSQVLPHCGSPLSQDQTVTQEQFPSHLLNLMYPGLSSPMTMSRLRDRLEEKGRPRGSASAPHTAPLLPKGGERASWELFWNGLMFSSTWRRLE